MEEPAEITDASLELLGLSETERPLEISFDIHSNMLRQFLKIVLGFRNSRMQCIR